MLGDFREPKEKPARRVRLSTAGLGVLTLLLGIFGGVIWMFWQQGQEINPTAARSTPVLAADEPAGPAGMDAPGERPPPAPEQVPVRVAIDRTQPPVPKTNMEDNFEAAVEQGALSIGSVQPGSEVYIDGKFVRKVPVQRELKPGSYDISIIAPDGRRKSFTASVRAGDTTRKVWDFDRGGWR
jgi:hypothetical protein